LKQYIYTDGSKRKSTDIFPPQAGGHIFHSKQKQTKVNGRLDENRSRDILEEQQSSGKSSADCLAVFHLCRKQGYKVGINVISQSSNFAFTKGNT